MRNQNLSWDYIRRAENRLAAIDALHGKESWADVVREAQEVVELALKALLRAGGVEVPRIHDVSDIVEAHQASLAVKSPSEINRLCLISRDLRRDRELAFYGSEDLTPSEFYKKEDADEAQKNATWVVATVKRALGPAPF